MTGASWKSGGGELGRRLVMAARSTCCVSTPKTLTLLVPSSPLSSASSFSNPTLSAAYEKNADDGQGPVSVVPDVLIQPESEEYWAPDPQTGLFGPPGTEHDGDGGVHSSVSVSVKGSVLEEEAFFRPTSIKELEKPIILQDPKPPNE